MKISSTPSPRSIHTLHPSNESTLTVLDVTALLFPKRPSSPASADSSSECKLFIKPEAGSACTGLLINLLFNSNMISFTPKTTNHHYWLEPGNYPSTSGNTPKGCPRKMSQHTLNTSILKNVWCAGLKAKYMLERDKWDWLNWLTWVKFSRWHA